MGPKIFALIVILVFFAMMIGIGFTTIKKDRPIRTPTTISWQAGRRRC